MKRVIIFIIGAALTVLSCKKETPIPVISWQDADGSGVIDVEEEVTFSSSGAHEYLVWQVNGQRIDEKTFTMSFDSAAKYKISLTGCDENGCVEKNEVISVKNYCYVCENRYTDKTTQICSEQYTPLGADTIRDNYLSIPNNRYSCTKEYE